MRRVVGLLAGLVAVATGLPTEVVSQSARDISTWPHRAPPLLSPARGAGDNALTDRTRAVNGLLSLALPGSGQLRAGLDRGWVYLAVEALAWGAWWDRRRAGSVLRDDYRDLAWTSARAMSAPRVDGDFEYYETVLHWDRSGAFDGDPGRTGVQPETNPATFNGSIWRRAAGLYLASPEGAEPDTKAYADALAYYESRAYGSEFLWSWLGAEQERQRYAGLIDDSDARFRQATGLLGLVLAHHVVSAVDAFLAGRGPAVPNSVQVRPDPTNSEGWSLALRWGLSR